MLERLLNPDAIEAELARRELERRRNKLKSYFPDAGPLRRELYPKPLEFFRAGALHRERLFMAGNRVGKTDTGCYEDVLHLTGDYPEWWEGRRFDCPIEAWVACKTSALTRDVLQTKLLGAPGDFGTGLIPHANLVHWTRKTSSVANAVDSAYVRHVTGGVSVLGFKSYAEGREAFQGTAKHLIHFDEEPDEPTYVEANIRTMIVPGCAAGGLIYLTFTPLNGHTKVVDSFLQAAAA